MEVEVIFRDNIASYKPGEIATLEYGPFLKALLLGEKAEVLNPPDFDIKTAIKGEEADRASRSQYSATRESPPDKTDSPKGTAKKSQPDSGQADSDSA